MANEAGSSGEQQGLQNAGDVKITAHLIKPDGNSVNIHQYIGEINLYEDMFKNGLYGNILIIDANGLTQKLPIVGEELIRLRFETPTIETLIEKTFKVYSITDRMLINDTGKQSYILHFCSPELFIDLLSPVYKTYSGKVGETVGKIFDENLSISRNGEEDDFTPIIIFGKTENEITFTSPGWTSMHCLNWLAARTIGEGYKNPGYLFYESNKAFYFANVEAIIDEAIKSNQIYQHYIYQANNLTQDPNNPNYIKDIEKEYRKVESMELVESYNNFKNVQNGYYANRLITLDLLSKKYEIFDYDHVASYGDYKHMENIGGTKEDVRPFRTDALRGPASFVQFYPKQEKLYTEIKNNANEIIENILPRRISTIQELGNFKMIITVPGRVDAEIGNLIYFSYPDTAPKNEADKSHNKEDEYYSGYYLITAIRHKFTLKKHMMIMEIVKDSYHKAPDQGSSE